MFTFNKTNGSSVTLKGQECYDWLAVSMMDRLSFQQALKHASWAPPDYDMWKETE